MGKYKLHYDLNNIVTFLEVSETKTISEASKNLHLTQPAITSQIKKLESELGVQLFNRTSTGVLLTKHGEDFLAYAKEIYRLSCFHFSDTAADHAKSMSFSLAASKTIASKILPLYLGDFLKNYHPKSIDVTSTNTENVLDLIAKNTAALGLIEGFSKMPGVRIEELMFDEIFIVVGKKLGAKSFDQILHSIRAVEDLLAYPLIFRENGSGTRSVVEKKLNQQVKNKYLEKINYTVNSSEVIKSLVLNGVGIGFLSKFIVEKEIKSGDLFKIEIPSFELKRSFSWVIPHGGLFGLEEKFYDFLTRAVQGRVGE